MKSDKKSPHKAPTGKNSGSKKNLQNKDKSTQKDKTLNSTPAKSDSKPAVKNSAKQPKSGSSGPALKKPAKAAHKKPDQNAHAASPVKKGGTQPTKPKPSPKTIAARSPEHAKGPHKQKSAPLKRPAANEQAVEKSTLKTTPKKAGRTRAAKSTISSESKPSIEAKSFVVNESLQYVVHVAPDFFSTWKTAAANHELAKLSTLHENFYVCALNPQKAKPEDATRVLARFTMPVHYMWPVKVASDDFIERASQGILRAFSATAFQNIQIFSPFPGLQSLVKNLRGRILQIAQPALLKSSNGKFQTWRQEPLKAPVNAPTLYICVTSTCVYAGVATPQFSGSFFAGGRRFLKNSNEDAISRASAKIVESLEHMELLGNSMGPVETWLELGASPGGMTRELVERNKRVVAVDRANLNPELMRSLLVKFMRADARDFSTNQMFDAILCDMNGPSQISSQAVANLAENLNPGGFVIFTLKIAEPGHILNFFSQALSVFRSRNLRHLASKHLFHNRQEITIFLQKPKRG